MELSKENKIEIINLWHRCLNFREKGLSNYSYMILMPCLTQGYHSNSVVQAAQRLTGNKYSTITLKRWVNAYDLDVSDNDFIKRYEWPIVCKNVKTKEMMVLKNANDAVEKMRKLLNKDLSKKIIIRGIDKVITGKNTAWRGLVFKKIPVDTSIDSYIKEVSNLFEKYFIANRPYFEDPLYLT